jgi:hypothetical protein
MLLVLFQNSAMVVGVKIWLISFFSGFFSGFFLGFKTGQGRNLQ